MVININSSSQHMYAAGGGSLPYVSSNINNPIQGMLRLNGSDMEVFDGSMWMKIYASSASVGLNNEAEQAISWAIERMKQEQDWAALAEKNAAVKIALDNLEQARQQVDIIAKLAREYDTETTS